MASTSIKTPGIASAIGEVFRQNKMPCLVLNAVVVLLVGSYYLVPAVAESWNAVGEFKVRWSYVFSSASTVFAAVLLPTLVQGMMGTLPAEGRGMRVLLLALFWGYRGMEIDLFYRFQGWVFGTGNDVLTLATKVFLDQFVMSPIWFVPTVLIAMRWADAGGSWSRTRASLDRDFWLRVCPTVMVTNWLVWIPTLAVVYSLPSALQFPLFSVVMCFFILIMTLLARKKEA
ncbi:MAG: hypothetical protein V4662_08910 [Verrucomicrobiota bacterium]